MGPSLLLFLAARAACRLSWRLIVRVFRFEGRAMRQALGIGSRPPLIPREAYHHGGEIGVNDVSSEFDTSPIMPLLMTDHRLIPMARITGDAGDGPAILVRLKLPEEPRFHRAEHGGYL